MNPEYQIPGDLPPSARLPDGEGRSEGESFALPRRGTVWELSPLDLPDGAGVSLGANRTGGSLLEPRSWDRPTPPPVAACQPLGGALGGFPAVAPMGCKASREP